MLANKPKLIKKKVKQKAPKYQLKNGVLLYNKGIGMWSTYILKRKLEIYYNKNTTSTGISAYT